MTLRVAHVTATFPPYRGGTGNVCYHNARELARRGHMVEVITAAVPGAPAVEQRDGFTIRRLRPLLRFGNAPVLPGLLHALRRFDVIHLHYPFFGGELTTLAAALRRTPLVITYHQDVFLPGVMGLIATSLRHTLGRATLRHATRLLFTSADYGRASYVRPMLGGREWTIGELPNGVDVQRFCPGPADHALRLRHGLQPDDYVLLLVAGLDQAHAFKGVEVLLQALTRLPPGFKALLVGDGDMRDGYAAATAALGLGQRVVFAGRVSDDALPTYYRSADVTVLPSVTMGEAFGLVLVESFACGTPVIASNLPGVRTVVQHEHDGLLVPPGDVAALATAMQHMVQQPDQGATMGQRGRQRVERMYAWEQIGIRLELIYNEVVHGIPGAALQLKQREP